MGLPSVSRTEGSTEHSTAMTEELKGEDSKAPF